MPVCIFVIKNLKWNCKEPLSRFRLCYKRLRMKNESPLRLTIGGGSLLPQPWEKTTVSTETCPADPHIQTDDNLGHKGCLKVGTSAFVCAIALPASDHNGEVAYSIVALNPHKAYKTIFTLFTHCVWPLASGLCRKGEVEEVTSLSYKLIEEVKRVGS